MIPTLCRMTIEEEGGYHPERLAQEVDRQLGRPDGAIDVEAVARALDIVEIRTEDLTTFEGALLCEPERPVGAILLNANSSPQRRRFTCAHELGHFLNLSHHQTAVGFECSAKDIGRWDRPTRADTRHQRQEREANRFAIELLAPERLCRSALRYPPDLEIVIQLAERLALSTEASVRRVVDLSDDPIAAVFVTNGTVRYVSANGGFPALTVQRGHRLPDVDLAPRTAHLTELDEVESAEWLRRPHRGTLMVQRLSQRDGYGMVLLTLTPDDTADDPNDDDIGGLDPLDGALSWR